MPFDPDDAVHRSWNAVREAARVCVRELAARQSTLADDDPAREDLQAMRSALTAVLYTRDPWAGWLRPSDCVHGDLYRLQSRNLTMGVWDETSGGFVGVREKFGDRFPFTEYHHDTGGPFGTARPLERLETCPITDLAEGHVRCDTHGRDVEFRRENPDGTGRRYHVDDGTVLADQPEDRDRPDACRSFHYRNAELLAYLEDAEVRFQPADDGTPRPGEPVA